MSAECDSSLLVYLQRYRNNVSYCSLRTCRGKILPNALRWMRSARLSARLRPTVRANNKTLDGGGNRA